MQHFANKSTFRGNVVDNLLLNPYLGVKFNAFFDFDFRLAGLLSWQCDRRLDDSRFPVGGEFYLRLSRWGAFVDNNLYIGKSLTPFYNNLGADNLPYADNLYTCDPFYGTSSGIYNRTAFGYSHSFVGERIKVSAAMVLKYDGTGLYCQQLVGISATICPTLYSKNHKK